MPLLEKWHVFNNQLYWRNHSIADVSAQSADMKVYALKCRCR